MFFALPIVAVPAAALAQVENWDRLKLISPHTSVYIRTAGKESKALIRGWKPDGLTIERGAQISEIARVDVERVAKKVGMSRARRAGWAALIGGGAGAIMYIGLCSAGECDVSYKLVGAAGAVTVGGISAGVAALLPVRKEVLYKRP